MKKTFDCVEMKNECAKKVRRLIGAAGIKQELAFWKERSEAMKRAMQRTKSVIALNR